MPRYEFRCTVCHNVWDVYVPVDERDDPRPCLVCQEGKGVRVMQVPHVAPIGGIPNRLNRNWDESGTPIDTYAVDKFVDGAVRRQT
jgi:putative FmdB family regulatory protein